MTKKRVEQPNSRPPTDLRKHQRQTERNLIVGGFVILFVVGGGLVWYLYGFRATVLSWVCLGSGLAVLGVLYLVVKLLDIGGRRG